MINLLLKYKINILGNINRIFKNINKTYINKNKKFNMSFRLKAPLK